MTKKKFFIQGITLTAFSLFFRITNIGYRSYLSQKIGAEGMGLYQLIFSIFMLTVTLSTSGISLAVTRMVTAAIAAGKQDEIKSIVTKCFAFCLGLSLTISCLLYFTSDIAAEFLLGNSAASSCLKILGIGLPFMSLCTCMKGYFLAVDESLSTAGADTVEQILTIGATIFLFWYFAPQSLERACLALMIASTFGEMASFTVNMLVYRRSLKRNTPKISAKSNGVMKGLSHIALPCTLSSAAKSMLNTGENLLIPRELQKFGMSYSTSISQYGLLQGMAMPMLFFPSSFLFPFASLVMPKIAKERELNHKNAVAYITGKAITNSLVYGFFFAAIFIAFGDFWGKAFYNNDISGQYLQILAPIVPLIYLDVVVDNLLKGMDEQLHSMKYNFADSLIRVILILVFLSSFGIMSYIVILFLSTILNAAMSLKRLLDVTNVRILPIRQIFLPLLCSVISISTAKLLLSGIIGLPIFLMIAMQILLSGGFYLLCLWGISGAFRANTHRLKKRNEL